MKVDDFLGTHAYLLMAHNNFNILEKLIKLLDYDGNDIYLHVDTRSKDFNQERFDKLTKKSRIFYVDRMKVNWGGYSQIRCELALLEKAIHQHYSYYHLLSGVDLPLKSQEFIHSFFEQNEGKEFVGFVRNWDKSRVKYFYLFNEVGRNVDLVSKLKRLTNNILIQIQKLVGYERFKNINFAKGSNWFSITHEFTKYVLSKKSEINKLYANSVLCDEVFLQTLLINSEYKNNLYGDIFGDEYENNMRYIDWNKGNPHVFTEEDYYDFMNSNKLFARKFDEMLDMKIVNMIYEEIKNGTNG